MRLILLLLLFPFAGQCQKWVDSSSEPHAVDARQAHLQIASQSGLIDSVQIKAYLKNHLPNLKAENADLILEHMVTSRAGKHYKFAQTINGRKVFRGSIKLNTSTDGRLLSLFDYTVPIPQNIDSSFPNHGAYHDGLTIHYATPNNGKLHRYELNEVYFLENDALIPAIHLEVVEATDRYYELVLDKDVRVIYQNDLLSYAPPQDSVVTMWVFNPDPLTTANQSYGAPYADSFDNDVLELNAERVSVQSSVTFDNDTFFLRNDWVSIEEFSFPIEEPVFSLTPEFNYTRSESGFEDVNAFYHINYFQNYIQSLGFNNIVNYPIAVDVHALNGSDNSNFNPGFNPPRLQFGEGGVDDAEDADVIIHEYGHAIMYAAAPGTNTGTERRSLDEAVGDYFASSYSRFLSPNNWGDVFTWDGHNEYWPGRSSVSTDHYPEDLNNNLYSDADIWSATLMQIWEDIGRETTDAIMIQAAYSFSEGMTMPQAAVLFLQADTLLFGGANFTPIRQRMYDRGLIPWNVGISEESLATKSYRVYNTVGFANGGSALEVSSDGEFEITLYNNMGQLLLSEHVTSNAFSLKSDGLSAGVYVLQVEINGTIDAIKLVKH